MGQAKKGPLSFKLLLPHFSKSSPCNILFQHPTGQVIRARYSPHSSLPEWKNDPPCKHQDNSIWAVELTQTRRHCTALAHVYALNSTACLGLNETWGNLAKSKLNRSAKWKAANWLNVQLSEPRLWDSAFFGKHRRTTMKSIPLDQWLAWEATKTNPLRTWMTAGTCVLVTQTLWTLPAWHSCFLMLGRTNMRWLTWGLIMHSNLMCLLYILRSKIQWETSTQAWRKCSLKETSWECNPNCRFAPLWNKTVYSTPMCHQTALFPAAREEIPAFFLTLILRCSAEAQTRCAYLHCATQVLLWKDPDHTKQNLQRNMSRVSTESLNIVSSCLHGYLGWNLDRYTEINTDVHTQRLLTQPDLSFRVRQRLNSSPRILAEACTNMGGQASCKHICVISSRITSACGIIWSAQMRGMRHSSFLYREAFREELHWISTCTLHKGKLVAII